MKEPGTEGCKGCTFLREQRYDVERDRGTMYSCIHGTHGGLRHIATCSVHRAPFDYRAPDWCPLRTGNA